MFRGKTGTLLIVAVAGFAIFFVSWLLASGKGPGPLDLDRNIPREDFRHGCDLYHGQVTSDPEWGTVCKVDGVIWSFYGDGKNGWEPECWYPPYWTEGDKFNEKAWNDECHAAHPEATIWHYGVPSPTAS